MKVIRSRPKDQRTERGSASAFLVRGKIETKLAGCNTITTLLFNFPSTYRPQIRANFCDSRCTKAQKQLGLGYTSLTEFSRLLLKSDLLRTASGGLIPSCVSRLKY